MSEHPALTQLIDAVACIRSTDGAACERLDAEIVQLGAAFDTTAGLDPMVLLKQGQNLGAVPISGVVDLPLGADHLEHQLEIWRSIEEQSRVLGERMQACARVLGEIVREFDAHAEQGARLAHALVQLLCAIPGAVELAVRVVHALVELLTQLCGARDDAIRGSYEQLAASGGEILPMPAPAPAPQTAPLESSAPERSAPPSATPPVQPTPVQPTPVPPTPVPPPSPDPPPAPQPAPAPEPAREPAPAPRGRARKAGPW